jgi:hypothetical protein
MLSVEVRNLARLKSSTHTPYLARHCRQNLVDSLPRGMPKVVDYRQTGVQATNEMVIQNNTRVYPGSGRRVSVIPYVLLCFVIAVLNYKLDCPKVCCDIFKGSPALLI